MAKQEAENPWRQSIHTNQLQDIDIIVGWSLNLNGLLQSASIQPYLSAASSCLKPTWYSPTIPQTAQRAGCQSQTPNWIGFEIPKRLLQKVLMKEKPSIGTIGQVFHVPLKFWMGKRTTSGSSAGAFVQSVWTRVTRSFFIGSLKGQM